MNLELLDPFGRQIPDRVDSTLELPATLHFRNPDPAAAAATAATAASAKESKSATTPTSTTPPVTTKSQQAAAANSVEYKAAYHVAFNRRGTYVSVSYASGTVAVFSFLSRALMALYRNEDPAASPTALTGGLTSLSWSRRSRSLLAGASGQSQIQLMDTTHPLGPDETCMAFCERNNNNNLAASNEEGGGPASHGMHSSNAAESLQSFQEAAARADIPPLYTVEQTGPTSFSDPVEEGRVLAVKASRQIAISLVHMGDVAPQFLRTGGLPLSTGTGLKTFPSVVFSLPHAVGGSLLVHPKRPTAGLAVLKNGSLVLFWVDPSVWLEGDGYQTARALVVTLWETPDSAKTTTTMTTAAFDPQGDRIYAATKDGMLLGFEVGPLWKALTENPNRSRQIPEIKPSFTHAIPGNAWAWHVQVSRNGKYLVINSADAALRLFHTAALWPTTTKSSTTTTATCKPVQTLQDVVSKIKFVSCDLSGDGEYVVGGANGSDNKYELYIWNTSTGALMDKLTGPAVQLNSVAWHPTRSFLAVATSDGLVDIWGPRINWTAFAPDFQALPMNVEYIEREDEFDVDQDGKLMADQENEDASDENETAKVDVMTIDAVPVFASDSEDEDVVFEFETEVKNFFTARGKASKSSAADD